MKTIFDFVKTYGNEPLNLGNFCDADALLFAAISYMDIDHYFKGENAPESIDFYKLFSLENSKVLLKTCWMPNTDGKMLKSLASTSRYENVIVRNPLTVNQTETTTQFFAVEFIIPNVVTFIVLRGTDKTLFGCVEDIKFALDEEIESIKIAKNYISKSLSESDNPLIIIGHSKGGTVAECSYLGLSDEERKRVIKTYNLDGPGTKNGVPSEMVEEANEKITKFITKRSVFGILLRTNYHHTIINGKSFWLPHHMVYNWEINDRSVVPAKRLSRKSLHRQKVSDKFIYARSNEELQAIITDVESVMQKSDIYFIKDIRIVRLFKAWLQIMRLLFSKNRGKEDIKFIFMCMGTFL